MADNWPFQIVSSTLSWIWIFGHANVMNHPGKLHFPECIGAWIKWLTFSRRHFPTKMFLSIDSDFTEVCSKASRWWYITGLTISHCLLGASKTTCRASGFEQIFLLLFYISRLKNHKILEVGQVKIFRKGAPCIIIGSGIEWLGAKQGSRHYLSQ